MRRCAALPGACRLRGHLCRHFLRHGAARCGGSPREGFTPVPLSRICAVFRKSAFYRRTQPEGCAVLQQQNKRAGLCRVFIGQYFEAAWLMPCRLFSHPQKGRWFFADCGKRAASFSVFRFSGLPRAGGRQIHGKQPHKRRKEVPFPCRRQVSIQEQAVFC